MDELQGKDFSDLFDDHARNYLLPRVMSAVQGHENGDPIKDFIEEEDIAEALVLLAKIGRFLGEEE